ncbi:murein hydrolase activator EnvC family protein [Cryptosporangium sp. NPDC051539]|uniref:murein hydrolase activator EnvC family protein n=1 Tax=Cryptosporangium sp. NPDC051539 TaxID=3363962 RepID=UPI003788F876
MPLADACPGWSWVRSVVGAVLVAAVVGMPAASPGVAEPLGGEPGGPVVEAGGWRVPVDGPVVRRFSPPLDRYGAGHRGVDLAGVPGAVVLAAGAGVVRFAGPVGGRSVVSVDHPGGARTTYEPLRASVRAGARVAAGTPLGVLVAGHPGCSAPACLHWGLIVADSYRDPMALLAPARVRLYPVTT